MARTIRSRITATLAAAFMVPIVALASGQARAETVYNIASLADFTGPYADIMKDQTGARRAIVDWWNTEVGKDLGVRLSIHEYDHRYDAAQVASLWPGIKSELNPIAALGVGGPDVAALQERLPDDKIPMIMPTAGYGYAWKPEPWIFNPRATYAHEAAAFYDWYKKEKGIEGPVKIVLLTSEASPAYVDIHHGMEKYAAENPDKVKLVEAVYTEVQPSDLTAQFHRVLRNDVDAIQIQTNTAAVVAAKRALQALSRSDVVLVTSSHNGLSVSGRAAGGIGVFEGDYEVYGQAIPTEEPTDARKFYESLGKDHGLKAGWNIATVMGLNQTLVAVRAIESAAQEVGPEKISGAAVREALLSDPVTSQETFGVLPTLRYSREAPFPVEGLSVNIGTVKNGAYSIAAEDVPVPQVNKW